MIMNKKTIQKFKWFWAWNDEKEEAWLGKMAGEGWHLKSLGLPGTYIFEEGSPQKDVYRMDYINDQRDYQNYLQLFHDAGWEHIGRMGGWQYFRKPIHEDNFPEIYTDNASKAQKYQRVLIYLVILLPVLMMLVIRPASEGSSFIEFYSILKTIMGFFMIFYVYAMVRIFHRINKLTKK
jgi:hypothetical protein